MARELVQVSGDDRLRKTLHEAGEDLEDLSSAHDQAAAIIVARARATAPRRTGSLASSVHGSGTKTEASVGAGGPRVPYAGPIHNGWPGHNIVAQPFITDAAEATEPVWIGRYENAMEQAIDKVKGI